MKLKLLTILALLVAYTSFAQDVTDNKRPPDSVDGPPIVSAKAWAIGDGKTGKLLWGLNESTPRQMASTTKIMTAWLVLELAQSDPKLLDKVIEFSERADKTGGTTADVRTGEKISTADLLYGLLLPSGNDAAVALGENFGQDFAGMESAEEVSTLELSLKMFVDEMNRRAQQLGMTETLYYDPHGNSRNRSSARDLVRLALAAMKNEKFREYVGTREHACDVKTPDGATRQINWSNTNQLLEIEGFDGIKTGRTGGAGSCVVSRGQRGENQLIVVVLGSTSADGRFVDARNLYRWAWKQLEANDYRQLSDRVGRLETAINAMRTEFATLNATLRESTAKVTKEPRRTRLLDIQVNEGGWGSAPPNNIRAVCMSAASELWKHFPDHAIESISIRHSEKGPMVIYGTGSEGERRVLLNVSGTYWAQFAFQFAHEFCHVLCRYREAKNPNLWFEESLCETASLFAMRRMAETWKTKPPYSNWTSYSGALSDYVDDRIKATHKLDGVTLAKWYRDNTAALRKTGTDRAKNQVVAVALLPILEKSPEYWSAIRYLNQWDASQEMSLDAYLLDWHRRLPSKHKPFVAEIAKLFEISIK